jgi:integrase/recombinase XerD
MDITGFLNHYSGLSESSKRAYRNTLVMLERKITDNEPTEDEARNFLKAFKKGTTLQRHKAAIKKYFTYKRWVWGFDAREFIPARRRLPRYLSREEVNKLVENAGDEHIRMFVKTLFMAGARIAELMSLTNESIEADGVRVTGKGDKERFVPIPDSNFMSRLKMYASKCKGRLFPESYYNYWLTLRRLCLQAGVEIVSPHTLRHSRAVDLVNRGVSLGGIQTFLGHEQASTTLIYTQLTQRDLKKELERTEG